MTMVQSFIKLEQVHRRLDDAAATVEQATGRPICIEHCGKCCETHVPFAMDIEAHYLLGTMVGSPKWQDIKTRAFQWLIQKEPATLSFSRAQGRNLTDEEKTHIAWELEAVQSRPCPFLADDKSCLVHEARPLVCRAYGATAVADAWCPRPLAPNETPERRRIVTRLGNLGQAIKGAYQDLVNWTGQTSSDLLGVSFFPSLIARQTSREELRQQVNQDMVPNVKAVHLRREHDLFLHQDPDGDDPRGLVIAPDLPMEALRELALRRPQR